jgi:hypothetical protein
VSAVWTKRATADDLGSTVTIAVANSTATSPSAAVLRAYRNAADIATAVAAVSADTSTVHATPVVTVDAMPVLVLEAASVRASPLGALQPPPADASPVTQMGAAPANPGGTGVSTAERVYDEGISVGGGAFTHDANVADATAWTLVLTSQSQSTHYYVKLVAKSLAGKASVPSAMAVASPSSINVDEGGLGSVAGTVQSPGYVVGESGYRFSEQDSQVPALNVISELGAGSVSADSVQLGADDLRELLDALPRGAIAFTPAPVDGTTGNTAEIGTTEVVCYDIAVGSVYTGRRHHIWCHGHLETDGEVGAYDLRMRYTTDGSTPGNGSPVLPGGTSRINFPSTSQSSQAFAVHSMYSPTVDYDNLRIAVTLVRAVGAGTAQAHIYGHNTDRRFELVVEDMGLDANIGGTIAQKSKEAGTVDPPPKATYTRTWNATWTRSFDSDGSARTPDTNDLYQGYISGTHGNTRSLVGFNYSDIQSKLSGSTINSIKLIYRVKHQGWGTGLDLDIGTHTYASRTSAWSSSNVSMDRGAHDNSKEGVTYTVNLPVAIGNDFRSGAARGIAIGPADANNIERYGYLYGYGSAYPPKIKITYTK